jgi:ubiquinone/menaquinone biosynthesis C-methylase UbiE
MFYSVKRMMEFYLYKTKIMETKPHVCPVWVGHIMASPLRKLQQNPYKILSPHISEGMNILEVGPAMGFFSIPMAKMTGNTGKVYCIDIQDNMLKKLYRRARKSDVGHIIETRLASADSLNTDDLKNTIDFVLLAFVVHEIPDQRKLFSTVAEAMKQDSTLFLIEPKGHVKAMEWEKSISIASEHGLQVTQNIKVRGSRSVLLKN